MERKRIGKKSLGMALILGLLVNTALLAAEPPASPNMPTVAPVMTPSLPNVPAVAPVTAPGNLNVPAAEPVLSPVTEPQNFNAPELAPQPYKLTVDQKASAYVPLRDFSGSRMIVDAAFFAEYFGAAVQTEGQVTTVSLNGHTLSFTVGEKQLVMDGIGGRVLSSENIHINGTAYLPLRFTAEALGAAVDWDEAAETVAVTTGVTTLSDTVKPYMQGVSVLDQATVRLAGEKVIYIDPYHIAGTPHDADVILITHTHNDHFNPESIAKLMKETTILAVTADGAEKARENGWSNLVLVSPNQEYTIGGFEVKTIPAYNKNHPQANNWVGYIVGFNGYTYYAAGDTDYIPDMDGLRPDVAFLPMDGRFNMDEIEAARAANAMLPKIAVPYHYSNFSTEEKARAFVARLNPEVEGAVMTFKMYE